MTAYRLFGGTDMRCQRPVVEPALLTRGRVNGFYSPCAYIKARVLSR